MSAVAARHRAMQVSHGRRATSFALAIALELLVVFVLLGLGYRQAAVPMADNGVLRVTLEPEAEITTTKPTRRQQPKAAEAAKTPPKAIIAPTPIVKLPTPPRERPLPILQLTRAEMASADISKLGTAANPALADAKGPDARLADGSDDSDIVGTRPNGQPIYSAEWVRKPTDQELSAYLPTRMPDDGGSGLVACRTAPGNRVQDCVEIANSPPGSHLASAVRQAAWQFLVRPPRKGGQPIIGGWVQIRIDYLRGRVKLDV